MERLYHFWALYQIIHWFSFLLKEDFITFDSKKQNLNKVFPGYCGLLMETSIIQSAPFSAGFLEIILAFNRCRNAPFMTSLLWMTNWNHIRKEVNISSPLPPINLTESVTLFFFINAFRLSGFKEVNNLSSISATLFHWLRTIASYTIQGVILKIRQSQTCRKTGTESYGSFKIAGLPQARQALLLLPSY